MRWAWLWAATLLVLPAVAAAQKEPVRLPPATPEVEPPAAEPPLATNRRSFFIPVTVDPPTSEHVPKEVHLLVSSDRGKTWSTAARQGAASKSFAFRAQADGEYWFASRTLDAQGKAKPAGQTEAELRIVIDTAQPKIELDAAVAASGEVKAAWRISDASLTPEGVRVEYQSGDSLKPTWESVTLDPALQTASDGQVLGSAAWSPTSTNRVIDVRIMAKDRAGNLATDVRRVFLPRRSDVPISKLPEYPARKTTPASPTPTGDPFTSRQFGAGGTFNAAKPTPLPPIEDKPSGTPWPADNKLPPPPLPQDKVADGVAALPTEPLARAPGEVAPPVSDRVVARPSSTGASPYIWRPDGEGDSFNSDSSSSDSASSEPTDPAPLASNDITDSPTQSLPEASRGGIDKPQLTNSKSFSLDYDVDSVGPSGMRAAELWVTIDGGQTWEKWGEDEDKRSPFEIQVQSERTFGFRMVIVANNGLATRSPEPGDPADLWVAIDSTKPNVRLSQAAYGQGEHAGQLDIRWEADDEYLGPRPVSLFFSETPEGPFTTLAAGLPNKGQHFWTIDPRTPRQLYLRLEVRDEAGNVGTDQTAEPVSLEGLSPKGRIRAVIPSGPSSAQPLQGAFRSPLFR